MMVQIDQKIEGRRARKMVHIKQTKLSLLCESTPAQTRLPGTKATSTQASHTAQRTRPLADRFDPAKKSVARRDC